MKHISNNNFLSEIDKEICRKRLHERQQLKKNKKIKQKKIFLFVRNISKLKNKALQNCSVKKDKRIIILTRKRKNDRVKIRGYFYTSM